MMGSMAAPGNLTELIRDSSALDVSVSAVRKEPRFDPFRTLTAKAIAEAISPIWTFPLD